MKSEILSRCGYRCDLCLAYKENIEDNDRRELLSDGWHKYFGFRIPPEYIYCDGCKDSESLNPNLIDKNCPVRLCVHKKDIENCAECDNYVCEKLESRIVKFEDVLKRYGEKIPEEERDLFIRPYENKNRLDEIRE